MNGTGDPTGGLLPEEVVMIVRLSTDVGTDLAMIKDAARQRAVAIMDRLVKSHAPMEGDHGMPEAGDDDRSAEQAPSPYVDISH